MSNSSSQQSARLVVDGARPRAHGQNGYPAAPADATNRHEPGKSVGRGARHRELIEASFDRAEAYGRLGDVERALEWIDRRRVSVAACRRRTESSAHAGPGRPHVVPGRAPATGGTAAAGPDKARCRCDRTGIRGLFGVGRGRHEGARCLRAGQDAGSQRRSQAPAARQQRRPAGQCPRRRPPAADRAGDQRRAPRRRGARRDRAREVPAVVAYRQGGGLRRGGRFRPALGSLGARPERRLGVATRRSVHRVAPS
jgi:hypothetical protein